ncbi:MAG: cupin domain-containing protein [Streptosporangiales bacterium]|nr:cupin domain-containing protein [Streptosporangiales bacterium]
MSQAVTAPRPMVVPLSSVPVTPAAEAVTQVRIARAITKERCGSNLLLGAAWMDPGEQANTWSSRADDDMPDDGHWYGPVDETYYIVTGALRLTWDEGTFELTGGDCVYLAPGWTYHLENTGDEPAFFVYSMTPTPE